MAKYLEEQYQDPNNYWNETPTSMSDTQMAGRKAATHRASKRAQIHERRRASEALSRRQKQNQGIALQRLIEMVEPQMVYGAGVPAQDIFPISQLGLDWPAREGQPAVGFPKSLAQDPEFLRRLSRVLRIQRRRSVQAGRY